MEERKVLTYIRVTIPPVCLTSLLLLMLKKHCLEFHNKLLNKVVQIIQWIKRIHGKISAKEIGVNLLVICIIN